LGQKFVKLVLKDYNPQAIRIFSRGELLQYQMAKKFNKKEQEKLRFFIGDVRDRERVYRATNGVDIVIHAAALKQIVLTEYNPIEAVKTNILGTINIIDASIDNNVKKVVLTSTDKAVNPINLYGATNFLFRLTLTLGEGKQNSAVCVTEMCWEVEAVLSPLFLNRENKEG
jgi:FlaA1/EpsC-like NDP-sugar epimerase